MKMHDNGWEKKNLPSCDCAVGFTGNHCETESRTLLFGNYLLNGTDNLSGVYSNLNSTITSSTLSNTKFILDVGGTFKLTCSITTSSGFISGFIIDPVTILGFTYSGSGSGYSDTLSLSVTKTDGINTIVYTLNGNRL